MKEDAEGGARSTETVDAFGGAAANPLGDESNADQPLLRLLRDVEPVIYEHTPVRVSTRALTRQMADAIDLLKRNEQYAIVTYRGAPAFALVPIEGQVLLSLLAKDSHPDVELPPLLTRVRPQVLATLPWMVTIRYFAQNSGKVLGATLEENRAAILTNRGTPTVILIPLNLDEMHLLFAASVREMEFSDV
jgi:hypothetical protein